MAKIPFMEFVEPDNKYKDLLIRYYNWLMTEEGGGFAPLDATKLGHCADRFFRDFALDLLELRHEDFRPELVGIYLANWYIVNTLMPNHQEVDLTLTALTKYMIWAKTTGELPQADADAAIKILADADFFHKRLEDFWALTPEGIDPWREVYDYRKHLGSSNSKLIN